MSTNLEYYLWSFIDYCNGSDDERLSKKFKYGDDRGYEYMYDGYYYHDKLREFFYVN